MPNHITNIVTIEVADMLKSEKSQIDFNSIIPMPKSLSDPDPQLMEYRAHAALGLVEKPIENDNTVKYYSNCLKFNMCIENLTTPIEGKLTGS